MNQRMAVWMTMLAIALLCGLPLNHITIFAVSIATAWMLSREDK